MTISLCFQVLGPAVHHLSHKCSVLEPADELFITSITATGQTTLNWAYFSDSIKLQCLVLCGHGLTFVFSAEDQQTSLDGGNWMSTVLSKFLLRSYASSLYRMKEKHYTTSRKQPCLNNVCLHAV